MDCSLPVSSVRDSPGKKEYWNGLQYPPPRYLPNPGIEPRSPTLQAILYRLSHQGSPDPILSFPKSKFVCVCVFSHVHLFATP